MPVLNELWRELEGYLETTLEIGQRLNVPIPGHPERLHEVIEVNVTVRNTAPAEEGLPRVVFMGVGLSMNAKNGEFRRSRWEIGVSRGPQAREPQLPRFSTAVALTGEIHPTLTSDELSHGQVLFPGEWVTHAMKVPVSQFPDRILVQATVSRRHLFDYTRTLMVRAAKEDEAKPHLG